MIAPILILVALYIAVVVFAINYNKKRIVLSTYKTVTNA